MTAPRILFVLGGAMDVGGAEKQLSQLGPELLKRGFEVEILCLWRRGALADEIERQGVIVTAIPRFLGEMRGPFAKLGRLLGGVATVALHVRRWRPDVIHFFLPHAYLVGGFASLIFRGPIRVMSRRGLNRYLDGRPITQWQERFLHRRMAALLGNSRRVANELIGEGAPPEHVGLIYNGIDLVPYASLPSKKEARSRLKLAPELLVLVKVANLWDYKGHSDLLEALAGVEFDKDWRLLLVGRDEGAESAIRRKVAELELEHNVVFVGASKQVSMILAASDIGISASHEEGFSNAVLEYLAAGLAVVVTDVGGNAESVAEAGLVVPACDPIAMRKALEMLGDPERRAELGVRAFARAQSFAMDRCVGGHETLYRSLLQGNGVPDYLLAGAGSRRPVQVEGAARTRVGG